MSSHLLMLMAKLSQDKFACIIIKSAVEVLWYIQKKKKKKKKTRNKDFLKNFMSSVVHTGISLLFLDKFTQTSIQHS